MIDIKILNTIRTTYKCNNNSLLYKIVDIYWRLSLIDDMDDDAIYKLIRGAMDKVDFDTTDENKFYRFSYNRKLNKLTLLQNKYKFGPRDKYYKYETFAQIRGEFKKALQRDDLKFKYFTEVYSGEKNKNRNKKYYYIIKPEYEHHLNKLIDKVNPKIYTLAKRLYAILNHIKFEYGIDKIDICFKKDENKIITIKELCNILENNINVSEKININSNVYISVNHTDEIISINSITIDTVSLDILNKLQIKQSSKSNIRRTLKQFGLHENDFIFIKHGLDNTKKNRLYTAQLKF